jgi:hypothetical protein
MRAGVAVALVVGAFAVGPASAATPSPCKLATVAEVKAAFGGTVGAGKVDPTVGACRFHVTHSNLGVSGDAIVFVTPGQSAATFKIARKSIPGVVTVAGIATAAFYNPHTTSIELLKGNTVASAQGVFFGVNAARIKADVVVLAKAVAKHV